MSAVMTSLVFYLRVTVFFFFFFQAEDGIRDYKVTGVQTCALPIWMVAVRVDADPGRHVLHLAAQPAVVVAGPRVAFVEHQQRVAPGVARPRPEHRLLPHRQDDLADAAAQGWHDTQERELPRRADGERG